MLGVYAPLDVGMGHVHSSTQGHWGKCRNVSEVWAGNGLQDWRRCEQGRLFSGNGMRRATEGCT